MTDESRQKAVGCLVLGGAGLFAFGVLLTVMLLGSASLTMAKSQGKDPSMLILSGIGPLVLLLGLFTAIGGLVWGFSINRKESNAPPVRYPGSRVLARYALMPGTDEMMFSNFHPDDEGIRFFAQLRLPDGRTPELQCAYPVFECMGEGMWGDATVQGNWIGAFAPTRPPPSDPEPRL